MNTLGIEWHCFNIIRAMYDILVATLSVEKLKAFSQDQEQNKDVLCDWSYSVYFIEQECTLMWILYWTILCQYDTVFINIDIINDSIIKHQYYKDNPRWHLYTVQIQCSLFHSCQRLSFSKLHQHFI